MQEENAQEDRRKQFEESNIDLESFFSSASHELHTPLRHITNFTELLSEHLQNDLDNQSSHYLDVISDAATEMNVLIDLFLEWAKIGYATVNFSRVNLNLLVSDVINSFESEVEDRNVEWKIENLPDVCGDSNLLRTAFVCLISNALKFTLLQPVAKIIITIEPSLFQENDIVMSIKDNGKEFKDDGISLATVKRIIQKHGGKVWSESEPAEGTTIYLTLSNYGQAS